MNIKSLLIGSAAALVAVSGAQAADAIVAAEPEPMEYVRVCDAFGTGFFYIPGTETCLQIGGEVRVSVDFAEVRGGDNWDTSTRARLHFDARNDTEYGTLQSLIQFEATNDATSESGGVGLRQAYIDIAGLRVGSFLGWWDDDIAGESDTISNNAKFNSARYTYDGGSFKAGLSIDELENPGSEGFKGKDTFFAGHDFGVTGMVGGAFGSVNVQALVSYDNLVEEWAARGIVTAEVGPGTLGVAGVWASDPNAYYDFAEWGVAASYAAKVSEKLTITPALAYYSDVRFRDGDDAWGASLLAEYDVTTGLKASAAVTYLDEDNAVSGDDKQWGGFVRLTRSF